LLAREVVQSYPGTVEFVSEDWGQSDLAKKFAIERYPAVFVDDILLAQPKDFGGWGTYKGGKYAPWGEPAGQDRFKKDLAKVIDLTLRGDTTAAQQAGEQPDRSSATASLPDVKLLDVDGKALSLASLRGKPVIVDFWATWCIPCQPALDHLVQLKKQYGEKVAVVGIVMDSQAGDIRKASARHHLNYFTGIGDDKIAASFGGVLSVPTMFVFDAKGKTVWVQYGAPPDLETKLNRLLEQLGL
jgi:thiol-disulfide isomerase/thioredoxin